MPRFDVTIAGELNLDLILYGLPEQLPPERELLADRMMLTLGASSAIVAHNLAALGSRVGFQSHIGDDQLGQIALDHLKQSGVDVSRVLCSAAGDRVQSVREGHRQCAIETRRDCRVWRDCAPQWPKTNPE